MAFLSIIFSRFFFLLWLFLWFSTLCWGLRGAVSRHVSWWNATIPPRLFSWLAAILSLSLVVIVVVQSVKNSIRDSEQDREKPKRAYQGHTTIYCLIYWFFIRLVCQCVIVFARCRQPDVCVCVYSASLSFFHFIFQCFSKSFSARIVDPDKLVISHQLYLSFSLEEKQCVTTTCY